MVEYRRLLLAKVKPVHKFLTTALILCLAIQLSACSLSKDSAEKTDPTEDLSGLTLPSFTATDPDTIYHFPSVQDVNENDIGVHPMDSAYEIDDSDGAPILRVSLSLPAITYVDNPVLQASVEATLSDTEKIFSDRIDSLSSRYLTDAASDYSFFLIPSYSVSYSITSYSENRISLLYTITETNADGIVNRSHFCRVIDLSAGFPIDLSTLFTAGLSDRLLTMVNSALADSGIPLLPSYESAVASWLSSSFLIVPDGICFLFTNGTLAPADQGDIPVILTTDALSELLSEYGAVILNAGPAYLPDPD